MKTLFIVLLVLCAARFGHAFPDHPLTLVNPYPATGSPDLDGTSRISRLIKTMQNYSAPALPDSLAQEVAQSLAGSLNQSVNIERRTSGNSISTARDFAGLKADGHALLFAGNQIITIYPRLYPQSGFDPLKNLAPVALIARLPMALVAINDHPAKNVRQVIERARMMPGRLNYAATGDGSTAHLTGRLFQRMSYTDMVHVNYNGSVAAINAVMKREVEFCFVPLTAALPFLRGGLVRIIAITSPVRHAAVPHVPTMLESGLNGVDGAGWFGIFAPAATPGAITSLLNQAINRALSEDFPRRSMVVRGLVFEADTPEDFRKLIEKDAARWSGLV